MHVVFLGRVGLDLVFVHETVGCVVIYAVVFLLFVWVDSGLVGFEVELVELVGGASRARHLNILCIVFVLHGVGMASLGRVGHVVVLVVGSPMLWWG